MAPLRPLAPRSPGDGPQHARRGGEDPEGLTRGSLLHPQLAHQEAGHPVGHAAHGERQEDLAGGVVDEVAVPGERDEGGPGRKGRPCLAGAVVGAAHRLGHEHIGDGERQTGQPRDQEGRPPGVGLPHRRPYAKAHRGAQGDHDVPHAQGAVALLGREEVGEERGGDRGVPGLARADEGPGDHELAEVRARPEAAVAMLQISTPPPTRYLRGTRSPSQPVTGEAMRKTMTKRVVSVPRLASVSLPAASRAPPGRAGSLLMSSRTPPTTYRSAKLKRLMAERSASP